MFTGIIQDMGTVRKLARKGEDALLEVRDVARARRCPDRRQHRRERGLPHRDVAGEEELHLRRLRRVALEDVAREAQGGRCGQPGKGPPDERSSRRAPRAGACGLRGADRREDGACGIDRLRNHAGGGLFRNMWSPRGPSPSTGSASRLIRAKATGFMLISSPTRPAEDDTRGQKGGGFRQYRNGHPRQIRGETDPARLPEAREKGNQQG